MAFSAALKEKLEAWVGAGFDDDSEIVWVAKFEPYDLVTEATTSFFFGTRTYAGVVEDEDGYVDTGFVDEDYVGQSHPCPSGLVLPSISVSVRNESTRGPSLRSSGLTVGEIGIKTFGGEPAYHPEARTRDGLFYQRSMANRAITLYVGLLSDAWEDFEVALPLKALGEPQWDTVTNEWRLPVKSGLFDPSDPIHKRQDLYFKGTGGLEGTPDMAGKEKPLVYGQVYGMRPASVDNIGQRYLVHGIDEACEEITTVYAGGLSVSFTPSSDNRYFDLASDPGTVEVTCDMKGAKPGGTYINLAGDIADEIFQTHAGLTAAQTNLGTYNTDFAQVSGLEIPWGVKTTISQALEKILRPRGLWVLSLDGTEVRLTAKKNPRLETVDQAYADEDIESVAVGTARRPMSQSFVGYQHIPRPISNFVGAVTGTERNRQSESWRFARSIKLTSPYDNAEPTEVETPWVTKADAEAEATAQLDISRDPERPFEVDLKRKPLFSEIGDIISIVKEDGDGNVRFNLDDWGGDLLKEDGDALLQETGDKILLGDAVTPIQVDTVRVDLDTRSFSLGGLG